MTFSRTERKRSLKERLKRAGNAVGLMKKIILIKRLLVAVVVISLLMILGIIGNIERGGDLVSVLWCVPLVAGLAMACFALK